MVYFKKQVRSRYLPPTSLIETEMVLAIVHIGRISISHQETLFEKEEEDGFSQRKIQNLFKGCMNPFHVTFNLI